MSIELEIKKGIKKRIGMNLKDADEIDVDTGDLIIMVDEDADESCVGKVGISNEVPPGFIELDQVMIDTLSSDEGNTVSVEVFEAELRDLDRVTFGIVPLEGQDINLFSFHGDWDYPFHLSHSGPTKKLSEKIRHRSFRQ